MVLLEAAPLLSARLILILIQHGVLLLRQGLVGIVYCGCLNLGHREFLARLGLLIPLDRRQHWSLVEDMRCLLDLIVQLKEGGIWIIAVTGDAWLRLALLILIRRVVFAAPAFGVDSLLSGC